jgi:hypothetical protein
MAGLFCLIALTGCANGMRLAYTKPTMAESKKGKLSVSISDQRVANRGGENPLVVGQARNAVGMPFAIKAAPNREPTQVVKELIADCLAAAGYEVVGGDADAPQLDAVLKVFWSDGYQHSRMAMVVPMELKRHETSAPIWRYTLDINTGFTWRSAGFSQFNRGFDNMLNTAKDRLIEQFQHNDFKKQYQMVK